MDTIIAQIDEQAKNVAPIGAKIKFEIDGVSLLIDGTGDANVVTLSDEDADTTISCSAETLEKLRNGELNPMMAVMTKKVTIKGDMGLAMKLQSLI